MAWAFISAASDLCQTLGYHRLRFLKENDHPLQCAQQRLFWTVHRLDKGLSLRLGRSCNIRDAEITLPFPDGSRSTRIAIIQGKVYDQLYSPGGLSRPDAERGYIAETLAGELRELISEIYVEVSVCLQALHYPWVSLTRDRRMPTSSLATVKRIQCE